MAQEAPRLPLARYRLHFEALSAGRLPEYAGSAWRGALGHALRRAVCVTRLPACPACLLYRSCAYSYVFETPPPLGATKMRTYPAAPHPFVLDVPWRDEPGRDPSILGLTLLGRGHAQLPYLLHAFGQAGEQGLGRDRVRYRLDLVEQESAAGPWRPVYPVDGQLAPLPPAPPAPPPVPDALVVRLLAPLRLKRDEHLVTPESFTFAHLFSSLLRRISMLTHFHTDAPLAVDFAALSARAREIALVERALRWEDWTRYSTRQKATMEMGGLMGFVRVQGPGLEPFWPYLWLGQYTHTGKGTSMGLGRYAIEAASLRSHPPSPSQGDTSAP